MLFVVILSLAALATAEPEIQQKVQQVQPNVEEHQQQPIQHEQSQKVQQEVNTVPFYKLIPQGSPLNIYGGNVNSRYFQQMMDNYPFLPYNYNNLMNYPYRSNNLLRELSKTETSAEQPKIDYGTDDVVHVRNINHHHMVNNVHDIKQKHILRKVDNEIVAPHWPLNNYRSAEQFQSPKTLTRQVISPYSTNQYFGKSLVQDQEYIQPNQFVGKSLVQDQEYIQPTQYFGKNLVQDHEYIQPYQYFGKSPVQDHEYIQPYSSNKYYGKNLALDQEYLQPSSYNRYWDLDYIRNYYGRNLNSEFTKPYPWSLEYIKNYYGRNLNAEFDKPYPWIPEYMRNYNGRNLNTEVIKSYPWGLDYNRNYYGKNLNTEVIKSYPWGLDYNRNYFGRKMDSFLQPATTSNKLETLPLQINKGRILKNVDSLDTEYVQPIANGEFKSYPWGLDYNRNYFGRKMHSFLKPTTILNKPVTRPLRINTGKTVKNFDSLDTEYVQPIVPETLSSEFKPEYILRNLENYPNEFIPYNYKNVDSEAPMDWELEGFEDTQGRFKRSEPVHGTANVETSVQLNHGVPVTQHQLIQGAIQQEGLRQDIQLNAHANAQTNVQAHL